MVNNFHEKANFIWQVADDILRGMKTANTAISSSLFVVLRRLDMVPRPQRRRHQHLRAVQILP